MGSAFSFETKAEEDFVGELRREDWREGWREGWREDCRERVLGEEVLPFSGDRLRRGSGVSSGDSEGSKKSVMSVWYPKNKTQI